MKAGHWLPAPRGWLLPRLWYRRSRLGAAAAALCLALATAAAAQAHAVLVRSDPPVGAVLDASPPQVQLWFSEPIEPGFSEVQLLDPSRRRVDRGDSRVAAGDPASLLVSLPPLDKGTYSVAWKALSSVDGHLTRGVFTLSIGQAPPAEAASPEQIPEEAPWEAVARTGGYLGVVALLGSLLFGQFVLNAGAWGRRHLAGLAWGGWALAAVSTVAALVLQVVVVGAVAALPQLVFATRYGAILLARLALLAGMALLLKGAFGAGSRVDRWLAIGAGAAVLLTNSLNSHSAALAVALPAIAADLVHQLAVALWVGGLFSFVAVILRACERIAQTRRAGPCGPQGRRGTSPRATKESQALSPAKNLEGGLATVLSRFSNAAAVSVAALIATGVYQAWLHVGSFEALFATLYGGTLLVKVGLVVPLLLVGAYNLMVLRPRVAVGAACQPSPAGPAQTLSRTLRVEAILGALVLAAAGLLTSLPPAKGAYDQIAATRPLVLSALARDLQVTLTMVPPRPGQSTFTTRLETGGQPVTDARVLITFTYLDEALGATTLIADHRGEGRYQVSDSPVGVEGSWQTEVVVQRPGQEDARTAFRFLLGDTGAREIAGRSAGTGLPVVTPLGVAGLTLVLLAGALAVYVKRSLDVRTVEGAGLLTAGLMVAALGIFVVIRTQSETPSTPGDPRLVRNPILPDQESLARGQQIYRMHQCDTCHGAQGRGDGPAAAGLRPRPADFRVHMAAGHTDGELFNWISNGVEGTAMPGYADRLSAEERWHVINFLKTFAPNTGG